MQAGNHTFLVLAAALALLSSTVPVAAPGPGPGTVEFETGPVPGLEIQLQPVASGLSQPLGLVDPGDGSHRLFILEKRGTVRVLEEGALQPGFYLDLRDRVTTNSERGLLGLAFAPDFAESGRLYVSYTGLDGDSRLVRHELADPANGAPGALPGELLLEVDQPFANHNGGHLAFGPDGMLYWSLGDGGSAGDPLNNGQDPHTLLGTLVRLDVSPATGYAIPEDNPFADGQDGAPEAWAYGLRNPWRFSFDAETGDLWIGDVGQNNVEEVDYQAAGTSGGQNYGWNLFEGPFPFRGTYLDAPGKTFPVLWYDHAGGHCSITGGHVYRGEAMPLLDGAYLYGDFCSGVIWAGMGIGPVRAPVELLDTQMLISSFGQDADGEVYVVSLTGTVAKLVPV